MEQTYTVVHPGDHVAIALEGPDYRAGELQINWTADAIEIEVIRQDEAVTGEVKLIVH